MARPFLLAFKRLIQWQRVAQSTKVNVKMTQLHFTILFIKEKIFQIDQFIIYKIFCCKLSWDQVS